MQGYNVQFTSFNKTVAIILQQLWFSLLGPHNTDHVNNQSQKGNGFTGPYILLVKYWLFIDSRIEEITISHLAYQNLACGSRP